MTMLALTVGLIALNLISQVIWTYLYLKEKNSSHILREIEFYCKLKTMKLQAHYNRENCGGAVLQYYTGAREAYKDIIKKITEMGYD